MGLPRGHVPKGGRARAYIWTPTAGIIGGAPICRALHFDRHPPARSPGQRTGNCLVLGAEVNDLLGQALLL